MSARSARSPAAAPRLCKIISSMISFFFYRVMYIITWCFWGEILMGWNLNYHRQIWHWQDISEPTDLWPNKGRQTLGMTCWVELWPVWVWKPNEKVQSQDQVSARVLNVCWRGQTSPQQIWRNECNTCRVRPHEHSPDIFPLIYKYPHCGTTTGWSIYLDAQLQISQFFLPVSWVLNILNNSSGRTESIRTEKMLNALDLRWVTSRW